MKSSITTSLTGKLAPNFCLPSVGGHVCLSDYTGRRNVLPDEHIGTPGFPFTSCALRRIVSISLTILKTVTKFGFGKDENRHSRRP
jgi:hypothetical protein